VECALRSAPALLILVDRQGRYAIIDLGFWSLGGVTAWKACGLCICLIFVGMPPWSLISPASRGIGFALARRILQTTNAPVVATARKDLDQTKEELLQGTGVDESRLTVLKLDVLGTLQHIRQICKM
jgi:hypothetical protein